MSKEVLADLEAGLPRRRRRRWVVHLPDGLVHLLARDLILARQVRSIGLGECLWVAAALTGAGRQVAGRQVAGTLQSHHADPAQAAGSSRQYVYPW